MEKLTSRHGPAATERAIRFLCIRLKPHAEGASIRERLRGHKTVIHAQREDYAEAIEERIAGTVEIAYRDAKIDACVMGLVQDLRPLQKTDAGKAAFMAAFPVAPSSALKGVLGVVQSRYVENLCKRLESDEALAAYRDRAPSLRTLVADADAAINAREALYIQEGQARTQLQIAVARAQRDYNLAFAELTIAFPDDAALVESLFWSSATSEPTADSKTDAETDAPAVPPVA